MKTRKKYQDKSCIGKKWQGFGDIASWLSIQGYKENPSHFPNSEWL